MSAYACEPGAGSEPGVGWTWTRAAALAGHNVWLLTRRNNRPAIDAALDAEPELNITPVYFDLPQCIVRWKRSLKAARSYYFAWQLAARKQITQLHAKERFDVAHHLTFATDSMPAAVIGLHGLPSIWGPVGGTGAIHFSMLKWLGWRGALHRIVRSMVANPFRLLFGTLNARYASIVIAQNYEVANRFRGATDHVITEPNIALSPYCGTDSAARDRRRSHGTHVAFVGRLVPSKGLSIAIAAMTYLPDDWDLHVVGSGPDLVRCRRLAARWGVEQRIRFLGQVERARVLSLLSTADVYVHPSLSDSAGWALAEAQLVGTPTVCLAVSGPATVSRLAGAEAISPCGNVPAALAGAMIRALGDQGRPAKDIFLQDRLPSLLERLYLSAQPETSEGPTFQPLDSSRKTVTPEADQHTAP